MISLAGLFLRYQTSASDFIATWNRTAQAIERFYYARDTRKKEMDDLLARYKPLAEAAKSEDEFDDIVNRMIAEFRDSHFNLLTTHDQEYYLMDALANAKPQPMPEFGAWFASGPDGYTVDMVLNGSEAEKAGIMKGDLVLKVDGQTFSPVESIVGAVGKTVTLTLKRGGRDIDKQVAVTSESALDMFYDATQSSVRIIDSHGHKVGYIHLWTEANDRFATFLNGAVLGKFKDTDACILDLRAGFGGRPEKYADPFYLPGVKIDWKSPGYTVHELYGYSRPLVVIIDHGSRSAKEVLSYIFKSSHRATLVGTTTAGNVLGTFPYRVSPWAYVEIPAVDVYANGLRLEGVGVSPDIPVAREFDEAGNDLYLLKALEILKDKLSLK